MLAEATALPEGVKDAVVNRGELANAMAVSINTIDNWRMAGMPYVSKGTNGRSYEYRLSECYGWYRQRETERAADRRDAQQAAAQMRLHFVNADDDRSARARLTPKDQKELASAQLVYMQAARQRRELIEVDEVQTLLEDIFANMREALDALPDRLAREAGLSPEQTDRAVIAADDILRKTQKQIARAHMQPVPIDEVSSALV